MKHGNMLRWCGRRDRESGQILIIVLVLLAISVLLIRPLVNSVGTSLAIGRVYQNKSDELYAADAGIEDAVWQIKYDHLDYLFTDPDYEPYDFTTNWAYSLPEQVNTNGADVTIQNIWIPNIAVPSPEQARTISQNAKLMVTGGILTTGHYRIKITYYPDIGDNLTMQTIGIWLPPGFSYVNGSSNLEVGNMTYTSVPVKAPHAGGQYVVWSFNSTPLIEFPGVNPDDSLLTTDITFQFNASQAEYDPDAVAWITTGGVAGIPFSWDEDIKVFKITSTAGRTTVESHIAKNEARELRAGFRGDYKATGNSLMVDTDHDGYYRETLLPLSSSNVSDIPVDATVKAAYLYWSARRQAIFKDSCSNLNNWIAGSSWSVSSGRFRAHYGSGGDTVRLLTLENSFNLGSFNPGTVSVSWNQSANGTLNTNDGIDVAFSADGGITWSGNYTVFRGPDIPPNKFSFVIPDQYLTANFKMRLYLVGFSGSGQYFFMDNIILMPSDNSVIFKIDGNQVYFAENGTPQQGLQELTASRLQVLPNYIGTSLDGSSYVGFRDVTELVKEYSAKAPDPGTNHPGNAFYTVGNVTGDTGSQLSYAGWSLVIIYSSPATMGHSLFLYDTFMHSNGNTDIDFDNDGQPGGTISGFIVPDQIQGEVDAVKLTAFIGEGDELYPGDFLAFNAPESYRSNPLSIPNAYKLWDGATCTGNSQTSPNNVWNSKSLGLTADGVDIDTFHVPWSRGLTHPGDTTARIDIPTQTDEWNLIYFIVSFRSEASTRGALNYIIRN